MFRVRTFIETSRSPLAGVVKELPALGVANFVVVSGVASADLSNTNSS
jgi:hypothetical protein